MPLVDGTACSRCIESLMLFGGVFKLLFDDKLVALFDRVVFTQLSVVLATTCMAARFSLDRRRQSSDEVGRRASVERQCAKFLLLLFCGEYHDVGDAPSGLLMPNAKRFWLSSGLVASGELPSASGMEIRVWGCKPHSIWYVGSMMPKMFSTSVGFCEMNFSMAGKSNLVSVCVAIDMPILMDLTALEFKWLSMSDESAIKSRLQVSAGWEVLRASAYESVCCALVRDTFGKFGMERVGAKRPPKSTWDASVEHVTSCRAWMTFRTCEENILVWDGSF